MFRAPKNACVWLSYPPTRSTPRRSFATGEVTQRTNGRRTAQVAVAAVTLATVILLGYAAMPSSSTTSADSRSAAQFTTDIIDTDDDIAWRDDWGSSCQTSSGTEFECIDYDEPVLAGHDVVSYWGLDYDAGDKPLKGLKLYTAYAGEYGRDLYYFATADNLKTFLASPSKYEVQWGSFCSWGVGNETDTSTYPWSFVSCLQHHNAL